jgi:hypothetical protein
MIRSSLILVAAACALALSGCGSSGKPSGSAPSSELAGIRFADCMRSHGVSNFPDPGAGGGVRIGPGINPQSPAFESAQKACGSPGPGGGAQASEQLKVTMLAESECMRRHGVPSFPDPVTTAPTPGNGVAVVFGHPGSFIAIPQSLINSPAFNRAAATCGLPGTRGGGPKKTFGPP